MTPELNKVSAPEKTKCATGVFCIHVGHKASTKVKISYIGIKVVGGPR